MGLRSRSAWVRFGAFCGSIIVALCNAHPAVCSVVGACDTHHAALAPRGAPPRGDALSEMPAMSKDSLAAAPVQHGRRRLHCARRRTVARDAKWTAQLVRVAVPYRLPWMTASGGTER